MNVCLTQPKVAVNEKRHIMRQAQQAALGTRAGFTLIEFLVVIAIIAILAAILFPVFAQACEKAHQTAWLSSTKQLSIAFLQST